jgi:Rrf2 family protein
LDERKQEKCRLRFAKYKESAKIDTVQLPVKGWCVEPNMRVTAKGEYATQAVLHLTLRFPDVVAISDIAQRHHIPLKYLEQILLELKRGGILESRRGVNGGYTLARAPGKISVGEILQIVDGGEFTETSCTHADGLRGSLCVEGESCGLKQVWQDVQTAVEKILFATSFEEVRDRTLARTKKNSSVVRFSA